MVTADQILVKQINKSIVLNTIRKEEVISRAGIAGFTGLNKSTVSLLVDELIKEGLVKEIGPGESKGGRKPIMLTINDRGGCVIGVDLGVNYILTVLTDLVGKVLWERKRDIRLGEDKEKVMHLLMQSIEEAMENVPDTLNGIIGIGIGVPGIVDYRKGLVLMAPNLKWEDVPLKGMLEERFKVKVHIDNEANVGAVGEKWFGIGMDCSNFIYVSAGIGIGTGIIINGTLYRGTSGLAGETGHSTINIYDRLCSCGNTGCWENYASERALLAYMEARVKRGNRDDFINGENMGELNALRIIDFAHKGSKIAREGLKEIGRNLGIGIINLINTFNPEMIVIGNTLSLAEDIILPEVLDVVSRKCFIYKYHEVKIKASKLKFHAGAVGAASLVISKLFAHPEL